MRRCGWAVGAVGAVLVVLATCGGARAEGWTGLYSTVTVTSDYRFDGVSSSNRQPTYQALFHLVLPDGAYAGALVSRVKFLDTPPTSVELDLYGGKHFALGKTDLNLEGLVVTFPDQNTGGPTYGMVQGQLEATRHLGRALTLKSSVAWSPQYGSHTGQAWHLRSAAAYALRPWLTVDAKAGWLTIARGVDRTHWDAGATATWKRWSLDVRYYATNLKPAQCYYTDWCAAGVSATVTYRLTP
jgi:uncharacterized protein (TIGR02001 family)